MFALVFGLSTSPVSNMQQLAISLINLAIQLIGLAAVKQHVLSREGVMLANLEADELERKKFGEK